MPISRKLLYGLVANVLGFAVTYAVTKLGVHLNAFESAEVSALVGVVANAVTGYLVKELPQLGKAPAPKPAPLAPPAPPAPSK